MNNSIPLASIVSGRIGSFVPAPDATTAPARMGSRSVTLTPENRRMIINGQPVPVYSCPSEAGGQRRSVILVSIPDEPVSPAFPDTEIGRKCEKALAALRANRVIIADFGLKELVSRLYSLEAIGPEERSRAQNRYLINSEATELILDAIERRINENRTPDAFELLLQACQEEPAYKSIYERLSRSYYSLSA